MRVMELETLIERLSEKQGLYGKKSDLRAIDSKFSRFIKTLTPDNDAIAIAALLLSVELGKGNVCLDFSSDQLSEYLSNPDSQALLTYLKESNFIAQKNSPIKLDGEKLYLEKYLSYELSLASDIQMRLATMPWLQGKNIMQDSELLTQLFPHSFDNNEMDWQAVAAHISSMGYFSVISGGPGTGKTTTVIRLLAMLIDLYSKQFQRQPIIKLAAPTGKAANRLSESITKAKQNLDVAEDIKVLIPQQALTLHRLLMSNRKAYNQQNPLHLDVLIIDEASMVDLPMMANVLSALPKHAQIILLGDKDQLASVEAGSVLADICDNEHQHGYSESMVSQLQNLLSCQFEKNDIEIEGSEIRNHICHLRKSYRFNENSGIGALARASNQGDFKQWSQAKNHDFSDLSFLDLTDESYQLFIKQAANEYARFINQIDPTSMDDNAVLAIHDAFSKYQILCALKDGPLGVNGLNEAVEAQLNKNNVIDTSRAWYAGRPIIVAENDYGLNLYNGDVGIVLPKLIEGKTILKACFIGSDQIVRWLQPSRLPKHQTVYAMTIHKSQGSEFDHVALVLPDYHLPILSKELLYTGITRAKSALTLLSKGPVIRTALSQKVKRASGLRERLWGKTETNIESKTPDNPSIKPPEASDAQPESEDGQFSLF